MISSAMFSRFGPIPAFSEKSPHLPRRPLPPPPRPRASSRANIVNVQGVLAVKAAGADKASERITNLIPPEQWSVYARFITEAAGRSLPFALGGGLAVSAYSACARNTKDMDIF